MSGTGYTPGGGGLPSAWAVAQPDAIESAGAMLFGNPGALLADHQIALSIQDDAGSGTILELDNEDSGRVSLYSGSAGIVTQTFLRRLRGTVSSFLGMFITDDSAWLSLPRSTTSPAPPGSAADGSYLFSRVTAGKGELCVRFPTGAIQVVATEP